MAVMCKGAKQVRRKEVLLQILSSFISYYYMWCQCSRIWQLQAKAIVQIQIGILSEIPRQWSQHGDGDCAAEGKQLV